MYYTYILYSQSIKQFYTGHTAELQNRLSKHNSGETKSISKGIPWELLWCTQSETRSLAMQLEKQIKSRGAKRFLLDMGIAV